MTDWQPFDVRADHVPGGTLPGEYRQVGNRVEVRGGPGADRPEATVPMPPFAWDRSEPVIRPVFIYEAS